MINIPYTLMMSGTSKGIYILEKDLPVENRDKILIDIVGDGVTGIGAGTPITSKVAIVSVKDNVVEYWFAQVNGDTVDYTPTCGNVLAGVGVFALRQNLVYSKTVNVHMLNSNTYCTLTIPESTLYYKDIECVYDLNAEIKELNNCKYINLGIPLILIDEKDESRMEQIRIEAGNAVGLGDVTNKVVPKIAIAYPSTQADVRVVTYIPKKRHPSIGVIQGLSVIQILGIQKEKVSIEHDSGITTFKIYNNKAYVNRDVKVISEGVTFYEDLSSP